MMPKPQRSRRFSSPEFRMVLDCQWRQTADMRGSECSKSMTSSLWSIPSAELPPVSIRREWIEGGKKQAKAVAFTACWIIARGVPDGRLDGRRSKYLWMQSPSSAAVGKRILWIYRIIEHLIIRKVCPSGRRAKFPMYTLAGCWV